MVQSRTKQKKITIDHHSWDDVTRNKRQLTFKQISMRNQKYFSNKILSHHKITEQMKKTYIYIYTRIYLEKSMINQSVVRSFQSQQDRKINIQWTKMEANGFNWWISLGLRNQVENEFITKDTVPRISSKASNFWSTGQCSTNQTPEQLKH